MDGSRIGSARREFELSLQEKKIGWSAAVFRQGQNREIRRRTLMQQEPMHSLETVSDVNTLAQLVLLSNAMGWLKDKDSDVKVSSNGTAIT